MIALCVGATILTGGLAAGPAACLLSSMASGALTGALWGAGLGFAGGVFNGALGYMEQNGTLDGSGKAILESASSGFAGGSFAGAATGAASGFINPKCFIAGTLIVTSLGYVAIENITPGMQVYAREENGDKVMLQEVVEMFERQTDTVVKVTIGEETYTTTPGHPFYVENEGFVEARELEVGDRVERLQLAAVDSRSDTKDGEEDKQGEEGNQDEENQENQENQEHTQSGKLEVEKIEIVKLEEAVLVYNFEVENYHTYYVGEQGVLVHNVCGGNGTGNISPYELQKTHSQTLSKKAMQNLVDDIKMNGVRESVKYVEHNGTKYIVDGHHRVLAAKKIGLKEIPVGKVELPYGGYEKTKDLLWAD